MTHVRYITETASDSVDPEQLHIEFESAAVTDYCGLLNGAGVIEVLFSNEDELSETQITESDAVLTAHIPGSLHCKIYRYTEPYGSIFEPPIDVSYVTGLEIGLYKSVDECDATDPSLPSVVTYYADASEDANYNPTYSDPVVIERYDHFFVSDVLKKSDLTISWIVENEDEHPLTKTVTTYF